MCGTSHGLLVGTLFYFIFLVSSSSTKSSLINGLRIRRINHKINVSKIIITFYESMGTILYAHPLFPLSTSPTFLFYLLSPHYKD